MTDDWGNDGSPAQIDQSPKCAERAGRDCGICTLDEMAGPERDACRDDTKYGASEP